MSTILLQVTKITAVLEQESWIAVDAPDEFQAIVDRLTYFDTTGNGFAATADTVVRPDSIEQAVSQHPQADTAETTGSDDRAQLQQTDEVMSAVKEKSIEEVGDRQSSSEQVHVEGEPNGNVSKPTPSINPPVDASMADSTAGRSKKIRERPLMKSIQIRGSSYHCVNCGLILLKMIAEYINISDALPALATEIVHRVAEILKLFNSRSCKLVLGAGAMQVAGLKSITAKHLALASQTISLFYALIPDIRKMLSVHIPDSRKILLLTEIDRVRQDYRVHKDEIHSKLVDIMKDRLLTVHLPTLLQALETWNRPDDGDNQASPFAKGLTKEVGILHRVLTPLLLEQDVRSIFTRIVLLFHSVLADAYAKVDVSTPQAKSRLYRDVQLILVAVRGLPSDNVGSTGDQKPGKLDELLVQRFGAEPPA
jgi:vacuolar protein sorting-associated protein 54